MKNIADIRRKKLADIVTREGLSSAAKRFGKPDSQINDMLAGRKSFGEKVARDLEKSYDKTLPSGWLDADNGAVALSDRAKLVAELFEQLHEDKKAEILHYLAVEARLRKNGSSVVVTGSVEEPSDAQHDSHPR